MKEYEIELNRCLKILEARIEDEESTRADEPINPNDSLSFAFGQIVRIFDERLRDIEDRLGVNG